MKNLLYGTIDITYKIKTLALRNWNSRMLND